MSDPVLAQQALEKYYKLYIRPEWKATAQTVITRLGCEIGDLPQDAGVIDLDPNWVDDLLVALTDNGLEIDTALPVLADALDFLCSRRVVSANPLSLAAQGLTTLMSRTVPANDVVTPKIAVPIPPPNPGRINYKTMREALQYLFPVDQNTGKRMRVGYAESTLMDTYMPKWLKLFAFLEKRGVTEVRKVNQSDLKAFMDSLPKTMAPQTRNAYIHAFRAFWRELIDDGAIPQAENPSALRLLKVRKQDKTARTPVSKRDLASLLTHMDGIEDEFERRTLRALVLAESFGGPRAFETVALNFEDIDWTTGIVQIRKGKGGSPRCTVLIQAALDDLQWLMEHRKAESQAPLLVNFRRGRRQVVEKKRITPNTAWRWLSSLGKEVGIHLYPHRLRHTAGSMAGKFGGPAYRRALGIESETGEGDAFSMALLGHSSAAVNADYTVVPLEAVREVMEMAYRHIRTIRDDTVSADIRLLVA